MLDQEPTEMLEARARAGEAGAFVALMRTVDHDLRGVVWAVVQSSVSTDEVMQSAYEQAFRSIRSVDSESELKPWLHSICYQRALEHLRTNPPNDSVDDAVLDGGAFARLTAAAPVESAHDRTAFDERFEALEPDQRGLVMLTMGMGFSFDETTKIVNMERSEVAAKASQARAKLTQGSDR